MSEIAFARSFLAALDARQQKLSPDHVEDPRSYPSRMPYILPRMPRQMSRPHAKRSAPGAERSVTVRVKSLQQQNPVAAALDGQRLTSQPLSTSVLEVKAALAQRAGVPAERVRLLHRKKPVPDSRVLKDLLSEEERSGGGGGGEAVVEFAVMVIGSSAGSSSAAGTSGGQEGAVAESEAFWTDLRGFLLQRTRDEKQAEELFTLFHKAWQER